MTKTHAPAIAAGGMVSFHSLVVPYLQEMAPRQWERIDTLTPGKKRNLVIGHLDIEIDIHADDDGVIWLESIQHKGSRPLRFFSSTYYLEHPLPGDLPKIVTGMPLSVLVDIPGTEKCTITQIRGTNVDFRSDAENMPWLDFTRPTPQGWLKRLQMRRLDAVMDERHTALSTNILTLVSLDNLSDYLDKKMRYTAANHTFPRSTIEGLGAITLPAKARYLSIDTMSGKSIVHNGNLILQGQMPVSMRTSLSGREARNLVDHDVFQGVVIGKIETWTSKSIIHLKSPAGTRSLGDILSTRPDAEKIYGIISKLRKEALS